MATLWACERCTCFRIAEAVPLKKGGNKANGFFFLLPFLLISLERALGGFRANKQRTCMQRLHAIHISTTDENRPRLLVHWFLHQLDGRLRGIANIDTRWRPSGQTKPIIHPRYGDAFRLPTASLPLPCPSLPRSPLIFVLSSFRYMPRCSSIPRCSDIRISQDYGGFMLGRTIARKSQTVSDNDKWRLLVWLKVRYSKKIDQQFLVRDLRVIRAPI